MLSDPKSSTRAGTVHKVTEFEEWPPLHQQVTIYSLALSDGGLWLHANNLGQLTAHLLAPGAIKPDGELDPRGVIRRCTGCPSKAESRPVTLFIAMTWSEVRLRIYLQGQLVASTDAADQTANFVTIEPQPKLYSGPMQDFSGENEQALRARSGLFAGHQPRRGRQLGDASYLLEQLRSSLSRLNSHIALVSEGKSEHVVDIAGALRVLIADNAGTPLLQHCAAIFEHPLIVFTHPHPYGVPPVDLGDHIQVGTAHRKRALGRRRRQPGRHRCLARSARRINICKAFHQ
jgi:hypothetical protein